MDLARYLDHDIQQLKVPAMDLSSKPDRSLIRSALPPSTAAVGAQRSLQFQLPLSTRTMMSRAMTCIAIVAMLIGQATTSAPSSPWATTLIAHDLRKTYSTL
jgi:hypothetical protein